MKKKHRIVYKKIAVVVLLILILLMVRAVWSANTSLEIAQEKQLTQQEKFDSVEQRIDFLENRIQYLDTEEGLEQEMLETFPIKRPGEKVIILVERDDSGSGFLQFQEEEDQPWWKFWK